MADASEFRELVRARTNIVELVGESVALQSRRGGSEFVGLCPFHDDHNPSMCVYPDRQSFRCWVCEAGGDIFSFVMRQERVSFPEALSLLADRVGLEVPRHREKSANSSGPDKPRLLEVLAWADRQFQACLRHTPEGELAREYLSGRGISQEMIATFGLGYHPRQWDWLLQRAQGRYAAKELEVLDLVRARKSGTGLVDALVDRVIFPIRDQRGRPVAFGGRILPGGGDAAGSVPKYLNSGETPLFSKRRLVYGLDQAREAIRRQGAVVVMEGYTDCIAAHQAGYGNVVATLGTALAESHVSLLKRLAQTVILVFDGDEAGRSAAERALSRFLAQDVDLRILVLPSGLDPADYLAKDEQREFERRILQAPEALEFKLQAALDRFGTGTVDARARVAAELLETVAQAPRLAGSIREGLLLRRIADRLAIPERALRDDLAKLRENSRARSVVNKSSPAPVATEIPDDPTERELLEMVITDPSLFEEITHLIGPDDFQTPRLREIFAFVRDVAELEGEPAYHLLMTETEDPAIKALIVELDVDARNRDLADRIDQWNQHQPSLLQLSTLEARGTDGSLNPLSHLRPLVANVVQRLIHRRELSQVQDSGSRLVGREPIIAANDESSRQALRQLQAQIASQHR